MVYSDQKLFLKAAHNEIKVIHPKFRDERVYRHGSKYSTKRN